MKINKKILKKYIKFSIFFGVLIFIASLYKAVTPQGQKYYVGMLLVLTFPLVLYAIIGQLDVFYFRDFDDAIRMGVTRSAFNRTNTAMMLINACLFGILNLIVVLGMSDFGLINIEFNIFNILKIFLAYIELYLIIHLVISIMTLVLYKLEFKVIKYFHFALYFVVSLSIFYGREIYKNITLNILDLILTRGAIIIFVGTLAVLILYKINSKLILQIDAR